ncbi:bc88ff84-1466-49cb-9c07-9dc2fdb3d7b7 [Sclerotinia trifoliorum]|uniref:Bc88ff84-1466-49cb-9c07-9dc2fdb3d7b7 n=1 Tax=Sclerotinia trifoliorum TaxID=28548 RepID=A0A8H2VXZ9_9HELO|nr:bc88ff84-1466-49cb-9c07-9dc2fdb3d7b7 [Sclerotinia trifoliorum]
MSSNQMNTQVASSTYVPVDVTQRHEYGIQKNRKIASTGGGRAWSEDEEVYLLQTRLQKMPYKHIASHLKKTELACRLHYHQLSHGSNRRKRTNSMNSSDSSASESSVLPLRLPSPINETKHLPATPPTYNYSPQSPHHVQLPSASSLLSRSASNSPSRTFGHPIAILPKPCPSRCAITDSAANQTLRLDCIMTSTPVTVASVDKERLRRVYEAHRNSFWNVIASEYGGGVSPLLLEETWKQDVASKEPPTPCVSPDMSNINPASYHYNTQAPPRLPSPAQEAKNNATSISALLGIDASPRSPKEREMIKRLEESREMS